MFFAFLAKRKLIEIDVHCSLCVRLSGFISWIKFKAIIHLHWRLKRFEIWILDFQRIRFLFHCSFPMRWLPIHLCLHFDYYDLLFFFSTLNETHSFDKVKQILRKRKPNTGAPGWQISSNPFSFCFCDKQILLFLLQCSKLIYSNYRRNDDFIALIHFFCSFFIFYLFTNRKHSQ